MLYPDIDPVLLELGPLKVRWYGLMYLIGFLFAWWLGRYRTRQLFRGWKPTQMDDLIFYSALGVVIGGRLGYILFYGYQDWLADPLRLFRIWEGGMSFHGGLIGVLVASWLLARKYEMRFFQVTDFVAPLVPIGLFAGRIGNFINGELWGAPSNAAWAMQLKCQEFPYLCYQKLRLPYGTELSPGLHPTQLYEAMLEGLVLFLILWFYSSKERPLMATSALFLIFYGLFRALVEFVRMPDAHIGYLAFDWLTMGQLLSAPMLIIGIILFLYSQNKARNA